MEADHIGAVNVLSDMHFGLRMMAKSPGFTVVAVVALGLGIGVNSMMFTIYNAALFKSLPFARPREVVHLSNKVIASGNERGIPLADVQTYQDESRSYQGIAAYVDIEANVSDEHAVPEREDGARISTNTFSLLGHRPLIGRDFQANDEQPDHEAVAILSYGFWKTRYGGDAAIIGRVLKIDDRVYTVVGVMPERMEFPEDSRFWIPFIANSAERQTRGPNSNVIARLGEGISVEQAQSEARGIHAHIAAAHPETTKGLEPHVQRYVDFEIGPEDRELLQTLLGAVTFVLLIACANVANLLLSRAIHRLRETSIRIAVGASRWRIIRQLLLESVLLSLLGGGAGLVFAKVGVRLFANAVVPLGIPYWVDWSMDTTAFLYLLIVSLATGVAFGLAPALQISRANIHDGLKETGRSNSGAVRSRKLANVLIVAEISLTVVLMVGGGLMIRSLIKRESVDVGVSNLDNIITMQVILGVNKYPQPADRSGFEQRLLERLRSIRDIESVTIASHIPAGNALRRPLQLEDRDLTDVNGNRPSVAALAIEAGYFHALGLTMPRGREFNELDGAAGAEAAIVNQRFAAQYWPGEDPVGKRLRLDASASIQVVGVAPTIRQTNLRQPQVEAMVYIPFSQSPIANFRIIARTRSSEEIVTNALRQEVRQIDPDLPLFNIMTLREYRNQLLRETTILTTMFSVFALIALVLSVVGIYAVTAYSMGQRTQEFGVRMALGADRRDIVWLVLHLGIKQLAAGLPLGVVVAYGVSSLLRNALFQVVPSDPLTFVAIPALLAFIIVAACALPARRAARLNPVDALRIE